MTDRDDTAKLLKAVERILEEDDLEGFAECWSLGRELLEGLPVRAFYACNEDSYANLAILADGLIVDIETEEDDDSPVNLTVISLKAVAEIHFHEGPVHTIPDSEDAQLTLVLSMVGATDAGPYWIAETNAEREHLVRFGKALLKTVNAS